MVARRLVLMVVVILSAAVLKAYAGDVKCSAEFSRTSLAVSRSGVYDRIRLDGCDLTDDVGKPQLPVKAMLVTIPQSARVLGIEVSSSHSEVIPGAFLVFPVQPPQILPMPGVPQKPVEFTVPDPAAYSSASAYPDKQAELGTAGNLLGYRVVSILVYPVQYIPSQRMLILYSDIELKIHYTDDSDMVRTPIKRSETAREFCSSVVKDLVVNGEDLESERPESEPVISMLPPGDYEYVIITSPGCDSVFQRLADWKTKKGVPADVVTTDSIYANYPGSDNAEKIRNFIKDAYANWGTIWVLLGGDTNIVPDRVGFAMDCQAGFYDDEDSIRADLYYSDLDETWDFNGNHIYGEVADNVDLYADVFVGRASCEEITEARTFVDKALSYERSPLADYQKEMGFFAEILWSSPYTDGGIMKDMIDDASVPSGFNVLKLYERDGNESVVSVVDAINQGKNIMNHCGHANYSLMGVGTGYLQNATMDGLTNGKRIGFIYSIGCWPAAFDYDCIAEHFVNNPNGGGMAFIGNSRYGWASPGNPGYGFSDRYDAEFFNQLFNENIAKAGATLAATKAAYAPRSLVENVYRWHQYEINILGEPEMFIWTDSLRALTVSHADSVPVGPSYFAVTVRDGFEPLAGALVCVMKGSEVYARACTDDAGQAMFDISPVSPGQVEVTVTAQNFLPYEGTAGVYAAGPFVQYCRHTVVDTVGNSDGVCNPGETIVLGVVLRNSGSQNANLVSGSISTADPFVTLEETLASFGDIDAGDTAAGTPSFQFTLSAGCANGHVVYFTLNTSDDAGHAWSDMVGVTVATPVLSCFGYRVVDTLGNGNGIPEPGETVDVLMYLRNSGLGRARGVTAVLSCNDPYVTVSESIASAGEIAEGTSGWAWFGVTIDSSCPDAYFPCLNVQMSTSESQSYSDSLVFVIGKIGFVDDVENGEGAWGCDSLWHITEHRSHSSTHSWYCGIENVWQYNNNMTDSLTSPWFVIGPKGYLNFWHWYKMPIYGSDGLFIEIDRGSGWELIDFKGCGGALDSLLPGQMWFGEWYDLSKYPVGDSARVRFRFYSDAQDFEEGWYIDDINIGGEYTGVEESRVRPVLAGRPNLCQNKPNPFTTTTTIFATGISGRESKVRVYDIAGRLVSSLPVAEAGNGLFTAIWDGRATDGTLAPNGVYFCVLSAGDFVNAKKMILVR